MCYTTIPCEHVIEDYIEKESAPHDQKFVQEVTIKPGTTTQSHKHRSTKETIEVTSGRGTLYINGNPQQIKAGDRVIILPGQVHSFYTKPGYFQDPLVFKRIKAGGPCTDYVLA